MISVLFLIPSLGGGGAEHVLVNLVNCLDKNKYEVTVQTLFDVGVNRKYLDKKVKYISGFRRQIPGNTKILKLFSPQTLYRMLIKEEYDIVISYLEGPTTRIVAGCPCKNTKLVNWIHTMQYNQNKAKYSYRNEKELNVCAARYDKTICVAEDVRSDYISIFPFAEETCEVLYNTNDNSEIVAKSLEMIADVKLSDELNVISVGRLRKEKGNDRLVMAHKWLLEQGVKHHIYLLGNGMEEKNIKKQIVELGVTDTFHLMGFQNNPYKYISKADLFVVPSRREGFSTVTTEALILGLPVVSTLCSGTKELLGENNEYGIVVQNSEQGIRKGLYRMLTEPELLKHYREKAKERGMYFSKENTVKAVENMFDNLLKE